MPDFAIDFGTKYKQAHFIWCETCRTCICPTDDINKCDCGFSGICRRSSYCHDHPKMNGFFLCRTCGCLKQKLVPLSKCDVTLDGEWYISDVKKDTGGVQPHVEWNQRHSLVNAAEHEDTHMRASGEYDESDQGSCC